MIITNELVALVFFSCPLRVSLDSAGVFGPAALVDQQESRLEPTAWSHRKCWATGEEEEEEEAASLSHEWNKKVQQ